MSRNLDVMAGADASEHHAAGDCDALPGDPAVAVAEQRGDGRPDVVRRADAPRRHGRRDLRVQLRLSRTAPPPRASIASC
jgi:hypothetical protein